MGTLPFVISPRLRPVMEEIGTPESGILLVERRGYLTAGEKNMVQSFIQGDDSAVEMIGLAREISRELNVPLDKSYQYLSEVISQSPYSDKKICNKIQTDFYEKIENLTTTLGRSQAKTEMVQAAAMIIHRVDKNFPIDDIASIHPDIIGQLSALYLDEERKSVEKLEEASNKPKEQVDIEEIEKKQ